MYTFHSFIHFNEEDKLVWKYKDCCFTVKFAYNFIMESLIDNQHLRILGDWMLIGNLNVFQKMEIFLWRLVRAGVFPTFQHLVTKGVHISTLCPHCHENFEYEWHTFFDCFNAKQLSVNYCSYYVLHSQLMMSSIMDIEKCAGFDSGWTLHFSFTS